MSMSTKNRFKMARIASGYGMSTKLSATIGENESDMLLRAEEPDETIIPEMVDQAVKYYGVSKDWLLGGTKVKLEDNEKRNEVPLIDFPNVFFDDLYKSVFENPHLQAIRSKLSAHGLRGFIDVVKNIVQKHFYSLVPQGYSLVKTDEYNKVMHANVFYAAENEKRIRKFKPTIVLCEPTGWRLVPVDPIDKQINAGAGEIKSFVKKGTEIRVYQAMVENAPEPDHTLFQSYIWPSELSDQLREVLGLMCFQVGHFASVYRASGYEIKNKAEDEQAFILHRFAGMALRYGDKWREYAAAEINHLNASQADEGRASSEHE